MTNQQEGSSNVGGYIEEANQRNSSSSMLSLQTVLVKTRAEAIERRKNAGVRSKRPFALAAAVTQCKKNKGIEGRIRSDECAHSSDTSSKEWKNVKRKLEAKAKIYDEMRAIAASNSHSKSEVFENQEILLDFGEIPTSSVTGNVEEQAEFDQIRDEFGREITVRINSSEYRQYIAEEARQQRLKDIQGTRSQHRHFHSY
jgi:hypothetical protein